MLLPVWLVCRIINVWMEIQITKINLSDDERQSFAGTAKIALRDNWHYSKGRQLAKGRAVAGP